MKKPLKNLRKEIRKRPVLTVSISIIVIFLSLFQIALKFRDPLVNFVIEKTGSDTFAHILYFDRLDEPAYNFAFGNFYFGGSAHYDFHKAKEYFIRTIELDNTFPRAHYQLSRVYFIEGDQENALVEINKELELYPDFKRSYYIRGLVRGYSNDLPGAAEDFRAFLAWRPESWAAHNDLAWVYFQQGEFEKSYEISKDGLNYDNSNPWLLNSLGLALKNMGRKEEAKIAFEKSLAIANTFTEEDWGVAYPGNDPSFYGTGLTNMKKTIENNLLLIK